MRGANRVLMLGACVVLGAIAGPVSAATAAPALAPAWAPLAISAPTNLPPGGDGEIVVYLQNVGGAPSSGTITVDVDLAAGLETSATPTSDFGAWNCTPGGAGKIHLSCTSTGEVGPQGGAVVPPGVPARTIRIPVAVTAATATTLTNVVSTTDDDGGAAHAAVYEQPVTISPTPARPGYHVFRAGSYEADGSPSEEAGSHPYSASSAVFVNTIADFNGKFVPAGDPKTIAVDLPPGFLANPAATPLCPLGVSERDCPLGSQVGLLSTVDADFGNPGFAVPLHAREAPFGSPGSFTAFVDVVFPVVLLGGLRSDEDYGLTGESANTAQIKFVFGAFVTLWGAPQAFSHEDQRCEEIPHHGNCGPGSAEDKAFLTMPSDCALQAEAPPFVRLRLDTWLTAGEFDETTVPAPAVEGCDQLSFDSGFAFQPAQKTGSTSSAFHAELTIPQAGLTEPEKLATPPLKRSEISFPEEVALNPSAADGLATCSTAQMGLKGTDFAAPNHIRFDKNPVACPDASKIGTLQVETPLLEDPLQGTVYLAAQDDNPFHSTLAVYLVVEDAPTGTIVKLPGEMTPDPVTGRLTAVFDDGPQLPVERLEVDVKGGDRAPLATPDVCGTATTNGEFEPWSAPESGPNSFTTDSFEVSGSCAPSKAARPFNPAFMASSSRATAGAYTPFSFRVARNDGEQELKGLELTLPPGLSGKLAGVATCSDAAIDAARAQASGRAEQATPSCPAGSELGTVTSAAGIGNSPIHVGGRLYLAGPYKGAPLSAVAIIPAVAGPYDLGNVVSRSALYVDPATAQLTTKTDPIPHILDGIPLALRAVKVNVDRANFVLNPTSCDTMSIAARMTGAGGDLASGADDVTSASTARFQVGGCDALAFKPKLTASLKGGTKRGDHPAFTSVLTYPPGAGYANTRFAQVTLPHSEFLDQAHIRTVCTRVQFAADQCPRGAIYGHAEASTPLLDQPLTGNVYLRSSSNPLPDLVVALRGPASQPIEVDLAGRIDSIHGGIRTTFDAAPDAPVSRFTLRMRGGKRGLLVNSRNLCQGKPGRLTVKMVGQNNKRHDTRPRLENQCKKVGKRHKRHHRVQRFSRLALAW